jgi:hypothetical protein
MSDVDVQWVQCAQCARHVRDSDKRCPFCERDAAASNLARPAAVVLAALVALAPLESSAERNDPAQRSAQSRMTSAYGAPAPMYGLAPTPVPPPPAGRYVVSVGAVVATPPRAMSARVAAQVLRTRAEALRCLDAERGLVPDNTMLDVQVNLSQGEAPNTVTVTPRRASASAASGVREVQACLRQSLSRLRLTPSAAQVLTLRWFYQVRHARRR